MKWLWMISLLHLSQAQKMACEDAPTVVVQKARGRLGNHVWTYMALLAYELKTGVRGYLTEDSRWILDQYFKVTLLFNGVVRK